MHAKKKKRHILPKLILLILVAALFFSAPEIYSAIQRSISYNQAVKAMQSGNYADAMESFSALGDYRDSEENLRLATLSYARELGESGDFSGAIRLLEDMGDDADALALKPRYYFLQGSKLRRSGQFEAALASLIRAGSYEGTAEEICLTNHDWGVILYSSGDFEAAAEKFLIAGDICSDTPEYLRLSYLGWAQNEYDKQNYSHAIELFELSGDNSDEVIYSIDLCYYDWGHEYFLAEQYEEAEAKFSSMIANRYNIGIPHFMAISEATDYIVDCSMKIQDPIEFFAADADFDADLVYSGYVMDDDLYALGHAPQVELGSLAILSDEKLVIMSPTYYPGQRIVNAWRTCDSSYLMEREMQLYDYALEIVSNLKDTAQTDLELEMMINDWICDNVVYDTSYCDDYIAGYQSTWTAVGAILDGRALCQGYADAFYLLASLAGFDVRTQFGYTYDESEGTWGGHVWNAIKLDGSWYYIDPTWNDSDEDGHAKRWYINFVEERNHSLLNYAQLAPIAEKVDPRFDYFTAYGLEFSDLDSAADYITASDLSEYAIRVLGEHDGGSINTRITDRFINMGLYRFITTWYQCEDDYTLYHITLE